MKIQNYLRSLFLWLILMLSASGQSDNPLSLQALSKHAGTAAVAMTSKGPEQPPMVQEMIDRHSEAVHKMLTTVTNADFPGFLSQGDARFQTFDRTNFNMLSLKWAKPLFSGFNMAYLGQIHRRAGLTTIWRIRPNDKSDDIVVILETNGRGSVSDIGLY